jgi:hypothetical protein
MIAFHVTFHDLPFIANTAAGVAEINEDWEAYMIGAAGTQVLNQGVGYAGSWAAEGNFFGIHGVEPWAYRVGDAGTQTMDDAIGFTGSWQINEGQFSFTGTESLQIYSTGSSGSQIYGGNTGTTTASLNLGYLWDSTGTWYCEPSYFSILANDDWSTYTVGTTGTQILMGGTGWSVAFGGSAWT